MDTSRRLMIVSVVTILLLGSCKTNRKGDQDDTSPKSDTARFYPLVAYFKEQIKYVDLRNFILKKTITTNSGKSVVIINKNDFIHDANIVLKLAGQWELNKKSYKENVFQDLSTASYTINYTAINEHIPLQRIDLLLNQETNIIKRIFIRENQSINDTVITRVISWNTDHGFQINTSKTIEGKTSTISETVNFLKQDGQ